MSIIANMKKQENGSFEGKLKTATLNVHLKLQPIGDLDANDNKPDFRAKIGSFEAGAGWNKISDNQNPYVSVQIDAPEFPNPIYANLVQKDDQYISSHWGTACPPPSWCPGRGWHRIDSDKGEWYCT